jgi:hypothetical protein
MPSTSAPITVALADDLARPEDLGANAELIALQALRGT